MKTGYYIAGDWGTSNLRLYLFSYNKNGPPTLLARKTGKGIRLVSNFEEELFSKINAWVKDHGPLPVLLSGMVGSNLGWYPAPYVACPSPIDSWFNQVKTFTANGCEIFIFPGLRTINPVGAPDVMRGEELQILGWHLNSNTGSTPGNKTGALLLPGTHNKWVSVYAGRVENFFTAFTGELFAILKSHSLLIAPGSANPDSDAAFYDGLDHAQGAPDSDLIHLLFSVRSRQISEELAPDDAVAYLSGLIIGSDVKGAIKQLQPESGKAGDEIAIIGAANLAQQYQKALSLFGCNSRIHDPTDIAVCGYQAMYEALFTP